MTPHDLSQEQAPGKAQEMSEPLNFHAIVGPNGMCMCGVEADGTVVTCGALLKAEIERASRDTKCCGGERCGGHSSDVEVVIPPDVAKELLEGATHLKCSLEWLESVYRRGVRDTNAEVERLKELNRQGISAFQHEEAALAVSRQKRDAAEADLTATRQAREEAERERDALKKELLARMDTTGEWNDSLTAPTNEPDSQQCVCGHAADEHGNDGQGHCGATKACRSSEGCKQFRWSRQ